MVGLIMGIRSFDDAGFFPSTLFFSRRDSLVTWKDLFRRAHSLAFLPSLYSIERFSDGSTLELRLEYDIETLRDGTKVEKLPTGTTIVRWPNGGGVVRNAAGTGAEFKPDPREPSRRGDLSKIEGTIELLPGG